MDFDETLAGTRSMQDLLAEFSTGELFALGVAAVAILWLLGATIHVLLRGYGFGVIGNSLFLAAGGAAGFYAKIVFLGPVMA
jgi:hypothetical protein